jgi:hypothetical protein
LCGKEKRRELKAMIQNLPGFRTPAQTALGLPVASAVKPKPKPAAKPVAGAAAAKSSKPHESGAGALAATSSKPHESGNAPVAGALAATSSKPQESGKAPVAGAAAVKSSKPQESSTAPVVGAAAAKRSKPQESGKAPVVGTAAAKRSKPQESGKAPVVGAAAANSSKSRARAEESSQRVEWAEPPATADSIIRPVVARGRARAEEASGTGVARAARKRAALPPMQDLRKEGKRRIKLRPIYEDMSQPVSADAALPPAASSGEPFKVHPALPHFYFVDGR